MTETTILRLIRLRATKFGARLFRNNVGRMQDRRGQWVAYGLGEGSSDLIGYVPVTITADMVGRQVAIFAAIEVKSPGKQSTPEQHNFIMAVRQAGGIAGVAHSEDEAARLMRQF